MRVFGISGRALSDAGGGTRTPDTRIMILPTWVLRPLVRDRELPRI
jgi:hypothetical protein